MTAEILATMTFLLTVIFVILVVDWKVGLYIICFFLVPLMFYFFLIFFYKWLGY